MQGGGNFCQQNKRFANKMLLFFESDKSLFAPTPKIGGELGGRKWEIASRRLWGYNSIRMRTLMSRPVR